MRIGFYQAKNGQGCTTVACLTALSLTGRVLLVDYAGDCTAVLGVSNMELGDIREVNDTVSVIRPRSIHDKVLMVGDFDHIVYDYGTLPPSADHNYLVTRECYVALRRAVAADVKPTGIVIIQEPGRALTATDVSRVIGAPVVKQIPFDPAIARSIDAGLMVTKLPQNGRMHDLLPESSVS